MAISDEIARLQQAKTDLKTAIENKGVTVPSSTKLDGYAALVDSIETGGGYEENVWYFCCKGFAKYLLEKFYDDSPYWEPSYIIDIVANRKKCWFEFNGEEYYVDSFSDGAHTLTKQGSPVVCNVSTFMTLRISQSGGNYVLEVVRD